MKKVKLFIGFILMMFLSIVSSVGVNAGLSDGLEAYYNPLSENNWDDLSGNAENAISFNQGLNKTLFDGNADYINNVKQLSNSYTINMFFKINDFKNGYGYLFTQRQTLNNVENRMIIQLGSTNQIQFFNQYDGNVNTLVTQAKQTGVLYMMTFTYDEVTDQGQVYVNGILEDSGFLGGFDGSLFSNSDYRRIGSRADNNVFLDGNVYNTVIYNRKLSEAEIIELYNNNGNPLANIKHITEQTYSQTQASNININDTDWHIITDGTFNISEDDSINYGEAIPYILSYQDDTEIDCRTILDDVTTNSTTSITLDNGEIDSIVILRDNIILESGEHDIRLECRKPTPGQILIGSAVGIGHVMRTSNNETINYKNHQLDTTINSGSSFGLIGSTTFFPEIKGDNNYILVDWSVELDDSLGQAQTLKVYPRIENSFKSLNCEQNMQYVKAGEKKTIGGICILKVNNEIENTITLFGTGININYNGRFNIKEFSYNSDDEVHTNILTGLNSTSSSFVEKSSTTFTTNVQNAEVIVKGSISAKSTSGTNILFGRLEVENNGQVVYTSEDVALSISENSNNGVFQLITPIQSGTNTFKLYLRGQSSNEILIESGQLSGYVTEKLDIVDNSFDIRLFEFWDNTQLSNFTAIVGNTTFETSGNVLSVFGESTFEDILISKDEYLSRLYSQHNTNNDLNATIGKYRLDVKASEIYSKNDINNFTLETDIGSFNTTSGTITLYPFEGIYNNWNVTSDKYFNKTNIEFQVGGLYTLKEVENISDTILNFEDPVTSDPIEPSCLFNNITINSPYELAIQSYSDTKINCTLSGYNYFTETLNKNTIPQNLTFNMNKTTLTMKMFDSETSEQINFDVTIINDKDESIKFTNQTNFSKNYNEIPTGELTIYVDGKNGSVEYSEARFYNTLNPFTSIVINGYLTKKDDSDTISFQINEKGFATGGIGDVNVEIQKRIGDSFVTIVEARSDADGKAFVQVDIGDSYKAIFKKDGFVTASADLIPGVTEYTVEMALESEAVTYIEDISYQILPSESVVEIGKITRFTGFISTTSLTETEFKIYDDKNNLLYDDSSTNPTGTTFIHNLLIENNTKTINVVMTYIKDEKINSISKEYVVINAVGVIETMRQWANDTSFVNQFIKFLVNMLLVISGLTLSNMSNVKEINLIVIPIFLFLAFVGFETWLQATVFSVSALVLYMGGRS